MKSKNKTNMKKINKIIAERKNTNFKYVDLDNQFGWKWDNEKLQFFQDNTIFIIYLLYSILFENKIFTCSKSQKELYLKHAKFSLISAPGAYLILRFGAYWRAKLNRGRHLFQKHFTCFTYFKKNSAINTNIRGFLRLLIWIFSTTLIWI